MMPEEKIADLKANFDYVLEGKDLEIKELKDRLAQTIENDEVAYETLKLHDQEEIGMLKSRVAELEKENAELKHNKKTVAHLSNCLEEKMKERIEELEKENAELKGSLELYENGCCRAVNECAIKDQLVQAKEIIRELLSWERRADYDYSEYDLIKDRAEQFLKEIEK